MGDDTGAPRRQLPPLPERETLRLHQANERTFLAWLRTALGLMGFGFVVARFGLMLREIAAVRGQPVPSSQHAPMSGWLGVGLTLLGVVMIVAALLRYRRLTASIERLEVGAPGQEIVLVLGGLVAALGLALAVVLLVTS